MSGKMTQTTDKFGVLFVHASGEPPVWKPVLQNLREVISDQVFEVESIPHASNFIHQGWSGIIYLVLSTKDDLIQIVNFLLRHQIDIKTKKTIRVGVFSAVDHSQVSTFLQKSGAVEVLDYETNQKAIAHKISVHLKLIEKALQGVEKKGIEFDKVLKGVQDSQSGYSRPAVDAPVASTPLRIKSSSLSEQESRWETGVDAFKKQGAYPMFEGKPVEIVNQTEDGKVTIDVPKKNWKVGEKFSLDFETVNLQMAPLLKINGKVELLEAHELNDRAMISIQLDPQSAKLYAQLQDKLDELQEGILEFMKAAKG